MSIHEQRHDPASALLKTDISALMKTANLSAFGSSRPNFMFILIGAVCPLSLTVLVARPRASGCGLDSASARDSDDPPTDSTIIDYWAAQSTSRTPNRRVDRSGKPIIQRPISGHAAERFYLRHGADWRGHGDAKPHGKAAVWWRRMLSDETIGLWGMKTKRIAKLNLASSIRRGWCVGLVIHRVGARDEWAFRHGWLQDSRTRSFPYLMPRNK